MSLATLGAVSAATNELPLPDTSSLSLGEVLILSGGGGTTEAVVIRSIASGRNIGVTVSRGALGTLRLAHATPTTVTIYDPSGGGGGGGVTVGPFRVTFADIDTVVLMPLPAGTVVLKAFALLRIPWDVSPATLKIGLGTGAVDDDYIAEYDLTTSYWGDGDYRVAIEPPPVAGGYASVPGSYSALVVPTFDEVSLTALAAYSGVPAAGIVDIYAYIVTPS